MEPVIDRSRIAEIRQVAPEASGVGRVEVGGKGAEYGNARPLSIAKIP